MRSLNKPILSAYLLIFIINLLLSFNIASAIDKKQKIIKRELTLTPAVAFQDWAAGYLQAGEVKHVVLNNGWIATWNFRPLVPSGEYKGWSYIPDLSLIVGVPEGPWAPKYYDPMIADSVSMGASVSESYLGDDWGPRANSWGNLHSGNLTIEDVLSGTAIGSMPLMTTSTLPQSWPMDPESNPFWPGPWAIDPITGKEQPYMFVSDQDVFFSMNDFDIDDDGFRYAERDLFPNQGYSLEIQLDVSSYSYEKSYAEDFLFFPMKVINKSRYDYTDVYIGFYCDVDVPEYNSEYGLLNDRFDWMGFNKDQNMAYIYDYRWGTGLFPDESFKVYVAVKLLETPEAPPFDELDNDGDLIIDEPEGEQLGLTDWHWFQWEDRPGVIDVSRQELVQYKVISGDTSGLLPLEKLAYFHPDPQGYLDPHFDSPESIQQDYPDGLDCVYIMSSGPFNLASGDTTTFAFCMLFGDDEQDMLLNATTAQLMYNYNYQSHRVEVISPNGGEVWSGVQLITWSAESITGNPIIDINIYYSNNGGKTWHEIATGEQNDGHYSWDTATVPDGIRYLIKVTASDGYLGGEDRTDVMFTINNPGNAVPEPVLFSPNGNERWDGLKSITWMAGDADGDVLTIDLAYSPDHGITWEPIVQNEINDGSYKWDTFSFTNSIQGLVKIAALDRTTSGHDTSDSQFILWNPRDVLPIKHISGNSNAYVSVNIIDSTLFTEHTYQLTIDDSKPGMKTFDVMDLATSQYVIQGCSNLDGNSESPHFDGLRVYISDWPEIEFNYYLSGWTAGDCNYYAIVNPISPNPADYEIRFTERGDTALFRNITVPFEIWNIIDSVQVDFMLQDSRSDTTDEMRNSWTSGDNIILRENIDGMLKFTWSIILYAPTWTTIIDPELGDVFTVAISRPLTDEDVFVFSTGATRVELEKEVIPFDYALNQNYPNPFNSSTKIIYSLPKAERVVLRVYNVLGQQVKTLVDEIRRAGRHVVNWDGKDSNGIQISSGVYFYQMKIGHFEKTRKMIFLQ
ncbi:MAG: T9SS type A sorting domain-containing protein [bacterium]|nr:MAG: T9SS type A sorting domain-containing protein [bacterium]